MTRVLQQKMDSSGNVDNYPWTKVYANDASAKQALQRHVAAIAQYHHMEVTPKIVWEGNQSEGLVFSEGTENEVMYRFILQGDR